MDNTIYTDYLKTFQEANQHYLNRLIKLLSHLKSIELKRKPKRV